jgi:hypothetical protein
MDLRTSTLWRHMKALVEDHAAEEANAAAPRLSYA